MAEKYADSNYYPSEFGGSAPDSSRLGYYQYITLDDLVNNFMFEKTGDGSLLGKLNRNKAAYAIQRSIQMLNYDVLKNTRSLNTEMNLDTRTIALPQDFVNVVGVSYIDFNGIEHYILPRDTVSTGQEYLQNNDYQFIFDDLGNLIEQSDTTSVRNFQDPDTSQEGYATGSYLYGSGLNDFEQPYSGGYFKRFGLNPALANENGYYVLDSEKGLIYFSDAFRDGANNISINYISDGLADDGTIQVNKLAEEAVYKMAEYKILSNRSTSSSPDYVLKRVKKEADTEMRNAKIRFMDLRFHELAQQFRNQNKWIKH